jgi:hypothetical protein
MSAIEHDMQTFDHLVPHGEEAFMVLKAQLFAEHSVMQFVKARVPSLFTEIQDRNSPVRSGLSLILLAEALSLRDEIPPTCGDVLWAALKMLNSLRNDLAHSFYPNTDKIESRMKKFVQLVSGSSVLTTDNLNLNQQFRACAQLVVGYLAIDRQPLTINDTN